MALRAYLFIVFLTFAGTTCACTSQIHDEILSLKCNLRFIAGKVLNQKDLAPIERSLKRNGFSGFDGQIRSIFREVGFRIYPQFTYEPNLNGGNPQKNLKVGHLEFISDPNFFRNEGLAAGASLNASGRFSWPDGKFFDFKASASQKKALVYDDMKLTQKYFSSCLNKRVSDWNFLDLCLNIISSKKLLSSSKTKTISFGRTAYLDSNENTEMLAFKVSREFGGFDFVNYTILKENIDFNGFGQVFKVGYSQSSNNFAVRKYEFDVDSVLNIGIFESIGASMKIINLEPLLGYRRQDITTALKATASLNSHISISFSHEITNSSIDYFDEKNSTISINLAL